MADTRGSAVVHAKTPAVAGTAGARQPYRTDEMGIFQLRRDGAARTSLRLRILSCPNTVWFTSIAIFSGLLVAAADHPLFLSLLRKLGVPKDKPAYDIVLGVIATAWAAALTSRKQVVTFLRRRLSRVNPGIAPHIETCTSYYEAVSSRIRALLPDQLLGAWTAQDAAHDALIVVRAKEQVTTALRGRPSHRISSVHQFVETTLLLNTHETLEPLVIEGEPGAGKSVFLFEIFRRQFAQLVRDQRGWIPLFIFAHELTWKLVEPHSTLKSFLQDYLGRCVDNLHAQGYRALQSFIRDNYDLFQFLIIVDGLDEIADRNLYLQITQRLNTLITGECATRSRCPNRYLVSCRVDDNQHTIKGRLLTLLPLEYTEVRKYLQAMQAFYKKMGKDGPMAEFERILRGLRVSRSRGFLQNYVTNPYLLSLIIDYYADRANLRRPYAKRLSTVFHDVLRRELKKPRKAFASQGELTAQQNPTDYLTSLLAPYCFFKTIAALGGDSVPAAGQALFARYLAADPNLGAILFGANGSVGYIEAVAINNSKTREVGFAALCQTWGKDAATRFRDTLEEAAVGGICSSEQLQSVAVAYLYADVLHLLSTSSLAEIDATGRVIVRFRHRRMQDYFAAVFVATTDIVDRQPSLLHLSNAWMREPLRLCAAVSGAPERLLGALLRELRSQSPAASTSDDRLDEMADSLLNVSAAVAYLPRGEGPESELLLRIIGEVGALTQANYLRSGAGKPRPTLGELKGWLSLREKWLTSLQDIYASQYLSSASDIHLRSLFRDQKRSWRAIAASVELAESFYRHIAYVHLYPVHRQQRRLPISRSTLFFYTLDAAPFFNDAFDHLIKSTHPSAGARILPRLLAITVRVISLCQFATLMYLLWQPTEPALLNGMRIVAALPFLIAVGIAVQAFGLMQFWDSYKVLLWGAAKTWQWVWPAAKGLTLAIGATLLRAGRIVRAAGPHVASAVRIAAEAIPRIAWRALVAIVIGLARAFAYLLVGTFRILFAVTISFPRAVVRSLLHNRPTAPPAQPPQQGPKQTLPPVAPRPKPVHATSTEPPAEPPLTFGEWCALGRAIARYSLFAAMLGMIVFYGVRVVVPAAAAMRYAISDFGEEISNASNGYFADRLTAKLHQAMTSATELAGRTAAHLASATVSDDELVSLARDIDASQSDLHSRSQEANALLESGVPPRNAHELTHQLEELQQASATLDTEKQSVSKKQEERGRVRRLQRLERRATDLLRDASGISRVAEDTDPLPMVHAAKDRAIDILARYADLHKEWESLSPEQGVPVTLMQLFKQLQDLKGTLQQHERLIEETLQRREPAVAVAQANAPVVGNATDTSQRTDLEEERCRALIASESYTTLAQEIEPMGDRLKNYDRSLYAIEQLAWTEPSTWNLLYRNHTLPDRIAELQQISEFDAGLPALQDRVAESIVDFEPLSNGPTTGDQSCRNEARRRLTELEGFSKVIAAYRLRVGSINFSALATRLRAQQDEIAARTRVQRSWLLSGAFFLFSALGVYMLFKRYGDRKGFMQLEAIKHSFTDLLEFIRTNAYSLRVNELAVFYLSEVMPNDTDAVKMASNVAESRVARLGHINERIGFLLREEVKGIGNIVNRKDR